MESTIMNMPLIEQFKRRGPLSDIRTRVTKQFSLRKYSIHFQGMTVKRLRWQAHLRLIRLGWPGVLGLSLIAFGLAYYQSTVRPDKMRLEKLHEQAVSLQERIKYAANSFTDNPRSPAEQLSAYYEFFPTSDTAPDWLRKIYQAAQIQDITLEQGDYRIAAEKEGRLLHYQVTFPVKGTYLQLRKFIATVLAEVPVASLDQVGFEKQKISDPVVEAKIRLTLYFRRST
jgi:hypothetical protein